ncbi:MAG: AAA family ATPase, partial [Halanaerobium sp.]
MKIKNIYIRDFGIFNNQELYDLAEGIVFIGGRNRAGKSSFLDIIRYLGYGLPQDGSIPPAEDEYYIQADLKNAKKHYSLSINGFAKPKITSQSAENISVSELYNNLDKFSYQQLFTISLDELRTISRIAGGKRDQKRLYSVLLGAGLSELVRVPEIAKKYFDKAAVIGGKEGRTSVYSFKPYYKEIKSAQKEKDNALKEIDQFIEIKDNLSEKKEEKKELLEKIKDLEKEELLLDILKNNYQEYEEIEKLKFSLSEKTEQELKAGNFNDQDIDKALELKEELLQAEKIRSDLEIKIIQKSSRKEKDHFIESLVESEIILEEYKNKKEVLAERVQNYLEQKEELKEKRLQLESEASQLNAAWGDPLQEIENIEADDLKQSEISRNLENYKNLKLELKNDQEKENDLRGEYELKQKKLEEYGDYNPNFVLKKTYTAAAIAIFLGLLTAFLDFSTGIYISSALLLMIYIYYSSSYKKAENKRAEKRALEDDISVLENKINKVKAESQEKNKKANELEKIIDNYRSRLGIKDNKALDLISDYYRTVQDKKSRLNLLKKDEKRLADKKNKINAELEQILKAVENTAVFAAEDIFQLSFKEDENISLIEFSQELFIQFDEAVESLELAKEFKEVNKQLKKIKKELKALTQKTEFTIN